MTCNGGCGNNGGVNVLTCGGQQPCDASSIDGCNTMTNCKCGCNPCQCGQSSFATPTPYYNVGNAVQESHNTTIIQQSFVTALSSSNAFNIPACNETAIVTFPGLVKIQIGAYLWNPLYGYLKVAAFDYLTGQVTVMNDCSLGVSSIGASVPACTMFNVVDPPCNCPGAQPTSPYLAVDFTAPDVGDCLIITVTASGSLNPTDVVNIGTGTYVISSIVSGTLIKICNTGAGAVPGSVVYSKDIFGNFITPITFAAP